MAEHIVEFDENMHPIIYDHREENGSGRVIRMLEMRVGGADLERTLLERTTLKEGDYIIGDYIIEAKEISDLGSSVGKRLESQLTRCLATGKKTILAVYGMKKDVTVRGQRYGNTRRYYGELGRKKGVIKSYIEDHVLLFPDVQLIQFETMSDFVDFLVNLQRKHPVTQRKKHQ